MLNIFIYIIINSTDSSVSILQEYVEEGVVTLIDWNVMPPAQAAAYNDFKKKYWGETQWVAFYRS